MYHNINFNHEPDYPLLNELFEHQDKLFEHYSKLLMLRIDFAYRKESETFKFADTNNLAADMTWLTERCREIPGLVGYSWVMEDGEEHRLHVHAAFYVNGQRHRKIWTFWERIKQLWEDITESEGYAHHCEPKRHYRVQGEKVVAFSDTRGREGMQYILSYLGKQSQRTERLIYQLSSVSASASASRGRPRSQR